LLVVLTNPTLNSSTWSVYLYCHDFLINSCSVYCDTTTYTCFITMDIQLCQKLFNQCYFQASGWPFLKGNQPNNYNNKRVLSPNLLWHSNYITSPWAYKVIHLKCPEQYIIFKGWRHQRGLFLDENFDAPRQKTVSNRSKTCVILVVAFFSKSANLKLGNNIDLIVFDTIESPLR
jgi:hypothetical protein